MNRRYPVAHQSVADLWADLHARRQRRERVARFIGCALALLLCAALPAFYFIRATS